MNNHNSILHHGWQLFQRWRTQTFIIIWLVYAAFYFTHRASSTTKLGIVEDSSFEIDRNAMAGLDVLYLTAYAVGQFVRGVLADRFGTHVAVPGGLLASALVALTMGTFTILPTFIICMVIQDLAQSTDWPGLCKSIGTFFVTYKRGCVLGLQSTCYALGGLVAAPFAGWCAYRLTHNWYMASLFLAGVILAMAVLFSLLQRNRPQDVGLPPIETEVASPANVSRPNHSGTLPEVLRNSHVLILGIAYFLLRPACCAILFWGPVIIYERMPEIDKIASAIVPLALEVVRLAGSILIGLTSDELFGARRIPACVLNLAALTLGLALFVPAMQSGSLYLVVDLPFMMGITLYGPSSMISGAITTDLNTSEATDTATGFVSGCGSAGATPGGLLPGYFDTLTVFFVFTVTALLVSPLLVSLWNSRSDAYRVEPKAHVGGPLLVADKSR